MIDKDSNDSELERKQERIAFLWALAEKIADKLKTDPRVESIWVSSSLSRGEADEFSDLDMAALIEKSTFSDSMRENRRQKWLAFGAEGWTDRRGDKFVVQGVPFTVDYLTLNRILRCGWDELEYVEWIIAGIVYSEVMYDPKSTLKRLKEEFLVYPEQLRKRRILQLDDNVAMYTYLAKREIKRRDYINASYHLRNAITQLAHLLFPLNGQYLVSKRSLLDRVNKLNRVPRGFLNYFRPYSSTLNRKKQQ